MDFSYSERAKQMRPSVVREILKMMADPEMISFGGGNPAAEAFPVEEIKNISNELFFNNPTSVLQYSLTEGHPKLREQAKKYLAKTGAVKNGDTVIITSGSQQIMDFLAKIFCNEGDVIATENPAFMGALNAFRSFGVKLAGVEMQSDGVDLKQLEKVLSSKQKPKLYYTIPNFQNPTGITTSLEKRKAVYELCLKYGVPILEDNPYGELRIKGEHIPPIKSFDEAGIVIYAASLSKILAPGMRVAMCAGPHEIMAKITLAKQVNDVHTNIWAQCVCAQFLEKCDMSKHLQHISAIYKRKARLMTTEFERLFKGRVLINVPFGGMFIWLTLPNEINMPLFVEKCLEKKLMLVPGNAFFVDENENCQSVRANFSTPTDEQIKKGAQIMAQVLDELMLA